MHRTSASLEGSGPTLGEQADSAWLEATPLQMELAIHLLTCPNDKGIKCQPLHRRTQGQTVSGHHATQQL
jgi:hypothetical protein